ncbi:hypothetical protein [Streptomyces sp. NPDC051286]|uniref:hypothetical protein n=1 Tax=Streptomyces sp. NPDC051286 TaxID=3365647 RepID=UPI0037AED8C1
MIILAGISCTSTTHTRFKRLITAHELHLFFTPERSLLGIISRTAYWVDGWRRFGPASGNEPKLKDPFGRYVITTFV